MAPHCVLSSEYFERACPNPPMRNFFGRGVKPPLLPKNVPYSHSDKVARGLVPGVLPVYKVNWSYTRCRTSSCLITMRIWYVCGEEWWLYVLAKKVPYGGFGLARLICRSCFGQVQHTNRAMRLQSNGKSKPEA
jgi:hypothetical protein